jgi:acyl carrier protein
VGDAGPTPPQLDQLETELKNLLIDAVKLEGVIPADIHRDDPLFFDGLGLDSMDALELGIAIERRYGIHFDEDSGANAARFASIRALAAFVHSQRDR